ncbi:MAG: glutathione S-transferase family protein [Kiloniellales bacterium]
MGHYRVYGRPNTGSFAPEMLLTEIGQPYELVPISKEAGQSAAYKAICPTAVVPALALPDGEIVLESAAICIHLTLAHPEAGLAPQPGSPAHASFLQWMVYLSNSLYEGCRRVNYADIYTAGGPAEAAMVKEKAYADTLVAYDLLEAALAKGPGPGLLGAITAVDHYLFMLMTWHPEGEGALYKPYPKLARLAQAIRSRAPLKALIEENAGPPPAV